MFLFGKKNKNEKIERVERVGYSRNHVEAFQEIADMLGVSEEVKLYFGSPKSIYKKFSQEFDERGIKEKDGDDTLIWVGIIEDLIAANKAFEFDFSCELQDFIWGLQQIIPEGLTINESILDEDEDITVWARKLTDEWQSQGFVVASLDLDSDSYITFICKSEKFMKLLELAAGAGQRISLVQDL